MMLKISELKDSQFFFVVDDNWEFHKLRVWGPPRLVDGVWQVDAEDCGNYCHTLTESDEEILFLTEGE